VKDLHLPLLFLLSFPKGICCFCFCFCFFALALAVVFLAVIPEGNLLLPAPVPLR
jgi:hypothetical protein